jgi:hypothetical protein
MYPKQTALLSMQKDQLFGAGFFILPVHMDKCVPGNISNRTSNFFLESLSDFLVITELLSPKISISLFACTISPV